jgi:chemotaxis protein CheZ
MTKAEIAEISVDAITESHIPNATDELDAIVAHTAQATDQILESCETLDRMAEVLDDEQAEMLRNATTQIYEACGFQDITGQRITKIVKALKMIEAKVMEISGSVDLMTIQSKPGREERSAALTPADLLNGPGLPHVAAGQADIDKLLAEFD